MVSFVGPVRRVSLTTALCGMEVNAPSGHAWNTYRPAIRLGWSSETMVADVPAPLIWSLYMFCCADDASAQKNSNAAAATIRFLISHLLESEQAYHPRGGRAL